VTVAGRLPAALAEELEAGLVDRAGRSRLIKASWTTPRTGPVITRFHSPDRAVLERHLTGASDSCHHALVAMPRVVAVSRDQTHRFSKVPAESITLVTGLGVLGDAHAGTLVQHRSRVRRDPNQPNLRQVHLIQAELFDDARAMGYELGPGDLGENILTVDLDLLGLPNGTLLDVGGPVVRLTGLRNPCAQINAFRAGLLKVVLSRADGTPTDEPAPSTASPECATAPVIRKAGVMAVVERGGEVAPGQPIKVTLPDTPHARLAPV
jgi:MOSC domain-containing protein YiiM